MKPCRSLAAIAVLLPAATASAQFDFSALTALAQGAVLGQNVGTPVPGFEILLRRDGQVLYHRAFGAWTLGRVAACDSATKTVSGALMMSLAETGTGGFSLDARLGEFLAAYNVGERRPITVRQAFSHTSGMSGDEGSSYLSNSNITLRQSAALIAGEPLVATPGSAFGYGGLSMQAAGAAAEVAGGTSYINLMSQRVTGPLEMTSTRFYTASDANPRVAGGLESTAADFSRFMDTLLNDGVDRATGTRLLSAASVAEMFTRQTTDAQPILNSPVDNNRYGIGVWLDQRGYAGAPLIDQMAAGARGFHSWIDQSEGLVFTFATDLTRFQNVESLTSMMHQSILTAIPEPGALAALVLPAAALTRRRR